MAKQAMFSLEPHVMFHDPMRSRWGELLGTDAAYLNAVVFAVHFYFDLVSGKKPEEIEPSRPAYKHLSRSLRLLREKLADDEARVSDSTLMVILTLAGHSTRLGHHETASGHIKGIRKIVDLRGGVADFKGNAKLLIEIFR